MEKNINLSIPVTPVKGSKFSYAVYIHDDYYVVVTHGNKYGELVGADGKTYTHQDFCNKLLEVYTDAEILVVACHADTRPKEFKGIQLDPLNSVGEVHQQYFEYFDAEEGGEGIGDLKINYQEEKI